MIMSKSRNEKLEINKSVLIENYCKQVEEKINALKLEYMRQWEKNHSFDSSSIDKKLKRLEQEKEQLCEMLNGISEDTVSFDLSQLVKAS
jgi:hypothetical protein